MRGAVQGCVALRARKRFVSAAQCGEMSETSGHFWRESRLRWSSPETEFSAREDYASSPAVLVSYTTLAFLLDYFFAARRVRVRYTALCNATRVINRIAAAA